MSSLNPRDLFPRILDIQGISNERETMEKELLILCSSCNLLNKISSLDLELYKEFNCILCSLIILIVDEEMMTQTKEGK